MAERRWVVFITPHQAQPGRRMRVDEGSPERTVKERVRIDQREHILFADGSTIPAAFARRKRWQIEVWIQSSSTDRITQLEHQVKDVQPAALDLAFGEPPPED